MWRFFFTEQTYADSLCRIPPLRSFVENFYEGLEMYLKKALLQMFPKVAGNFSKKNWSSLREFRYIL